MKIQILAAPAGYVLDSSGIGSEYYWPLRLMSEVSSAYDIKYMALVSKANLSNHLSRKIKILELTGKVEHNYLTKALFYLRLSSIGNKLISKYPFTLLQHILPFAFEKSFNPVALSNADIPFLIGPVSAPHTQHFEDELVFDKINYNPLTTHVKFQINRTNEYLLAPILRYLFIKTLERAYRVMVVSENARAYYQRYVSNRKLIVLPYGVDTELFYPSKKLKKPGDEIKILAVGYLTRRKGFEYLLKALRRVIRSSHCKVSLDIVGEGPQLPMLKRLANELGISKYVIFHGKKHSAKFFQSADIFLNPALSETWTVLLEAMASGCPIITTDVGSARDFCKHGQNGFLVPPANDEAIAEALLDLVDNEELRLRMSFFNRRKAEEYSWSTFARRLYEIYVSIL